MLEQYPEISISLHTSGCLMEWLVERKPEYIERLRRLVSRGQIEIVGGGFYEPILPMIPPRDRVGQIRTYTTYLENLFKTHVRGMWVPERVWEQNLVCRLLLEKKKKAKRVAEFYTYLTILPVADFRLRCLNSIL